MEWKRESIFVSALRTFCRMFFGILGITLSLFIFSLIFTALSPSTSSTEKTSLEMLPNAKGQRSSLSFSDPLILQINIHGVIGEPKKLESSTIENILLDSRSSTLSPRIKGILLHLNTPGGTVVDSDNIYRLLLQYKELYQVPIYAYVDGMCASGGMYVASAADRIYASPASVIGSVGVVLGPFFNLFDALTKLGISSKTLTQGLDKDMFNPTRPWKEGEDASLQAIMAYYYHRFVEIVTSARPQLSRQKLIQEYGAKIFDPLTAQEYGYIDEANVSREEALLALLEEAHISKDQSYQVIELQPKNLWLSTFLNQSPLVTGKWEHELPIEQPKIQSAFSYLYQP